MTNAFFACATCGGFGFLRRGVFPSSFQPCTACHGIGQRYIDGAAPETPAATSHPSLGATPLLGQLLP